MSDKPGKILLGKTNQLFPVDARKARALDTTNRNLKEFPTDVPARRWDRNGKPVSSVIFRHGNIEP